MYTSTYSDRLGVSSNSSNTASKEEGNNAPRAEAIPHHTISL